MCGNPISGPSSRINDDRGIEDDAMAMATADARRAFVVVAVVVAVVAACAVSDVVGAVDGCCTARLSVRRWPSRMNRHAKGRRVSNT